MPADRWTARLGLREGRLVLRWGGERRPHAARGVYRLRAPAPVPRLCGRSPELCIEPADDLAATAASVAAERHPVSPQLRAFLAHGALWEGAPLVRRQLELRLDGEADPLLAATCRRAAFLAAHGERPPLAVASCDSPQQLMLTRLAEGLAAQLCGLRGFTRRSLQVSGPRLEAGGLLEVVDVRYRGADAFRVCRARAAAPPPEIWPAGAAALLPVHAHLMVVRELGPWSHAPVSVGKAWTALGKPASRWLVHTHPIALPQRPLEPAQPGPWAEGALAQGARPVPAGANLSPALRAAWGHLAQRLRAPG